MKKKASKTVGYRIAVADKSQGWVPPPWDAHYQWMRIEQSGKSKVALPVSDTRGFVFKTRSEALQEAWGWRHAWHVRLVRVIE